MSEIFVSSIDNIAKKNFCTRVTFDNYAKPHSLKDTLRYDANETSDKIVDDETAIDSILSSKKTKYRLTLYLAEKLLYNSNERIVKVTREGVRANNNEVNQTTSVSTQEEADTLMIIHAVEIVQTGFSVDFFSQDTDWLVLLLRRHDILGALPRMLTGHKDLRRLI
ncbi:hypothetical protein DPMN_112881 [Dreissena polymorpha]|uniref:Uncharacterized protein n=1 Tax=Dreissena polymorpha TaxID=45954 RepID=A0A9D4KGH0_DREPO|nr:hypothetical protein DPMN_112881 [Dreissena polymorpha]